MDSSTSTRQNRVRQNYDHKWDCETCRPYKEEKEGRRILDGFEGHDMYLSVIANSDLERVGRLSRRLGASYVPVPCGSHRAVLSTLPLGEHSVLVEDHDAVVMGLVMKLRWNGRLGGTRGFLPPARPPSDVWEAYHPSTGRRCWHRHETREEAQECARLTGERLDGSSTGWYVRRGSHWRLLGTVRVDRKRVFAEHRSDPSPKPLDLLVMEELARIAKDCGLRLASTRLVVGGHLEFAPVAWDDPRFVEFRARTGWKPPARSGDRWQPPIEPVGWKVDGRGTVSGAS